MLTNLRDGINSLKRQLNMQRPDEGVEMQADDDELTDQEVAQFCGQLDEDEFVEEMEMGEGESEAVVEGAEKQGTGIEKEKHQLKHAEEERERERERWWIPR